MEANWLISGEMKITRVLDDEEVKAVNEAAGTRIFHAWLDYWRKVSSNLGSSYRTKEEVLEGGLMDQSQKYMDSFKEDG